MLAVGPVEVVRWGPMQTRRHYNGLKTILLFVGIIVNLLLRKGKSPAEEREAEEKKYESDGQDKLF